MYVCMYAYIYIIIYIYTSVYIYIIIYECTWIDQLNAVHCVLACSHSSCGVGPVTRLVKRAHSRWKTQTRIPAGT